MLSRRNLLMILGASVLPSRSGHAADVALPGGAAIRYGEGVPFSFAALVAHAEATNASPYVPRPDPAPALLARIGYEQHHQVRQPVSGGLFAERGSDGIVTMFHLGELFRRPVRIHEVEGGVAREVIYASDYFAYPSDNAAALVPGDAGFAGFRVHEPWTGEKEPGDWLAFLGASYFRSSGDLKQYGISARGLALETAAFDGIGEEFPDFTDFWIERMQGGTMLIHALLQGPSVTGAYRFEVTRRPAVVMEISCRLFLRRDIKRLGVAPLTSMYWYSQEARWVQGDWRPEVHDSDGLMIHEGDAGAIWRPLTNPAALSLSSFPVKRPRGFGLMQRDRSYASYEDQAAFERRPNIWVEPIEGFDDGEVQLIEFPTGSEYGDNIVAFYVPATPARAGEALAFAYRLHWSGAEPRQALARMTALRLGRPRRHRPAPAENQPVRIERKLILDYVGAGLSAATPSPDAVTVSLTHGTVRGVQAHPSVDRPDGWRVVFDALLEDAAPCEATVKLGQGEGLLAETVVFRFWPESGLPVPRNAR